MRENEGNSVRNRLTGVVSLAAAFTVIASLAPGVALAAAAPAVTGFSPIGGDAGASFTISGSGFGTDTAAAKVSINGVTATVTAAADNSLTALVPAGTGAGKVQVSTPDGSASSAEDFVIAPERYKFADIAYTSGILPDSKGQLVDINAAKKIGLIRFSGTAGQRVSFGFDKSTLNSRFDVKPYLPNGKQLLVDGFRVEKNFAKEGGQYLLPPLPVTGTYSLVIDPTTDTGVGKINVIQPNIKDGGVLSPTGAATSIAFHDPWYQVALTINAEAGQVYSLTPTDWNFPASAQVMATIFGPDDRQLFSSTPFSARPSALSFEAKVAGRYQVFLVSDSLTVGSQPGSLVITLSQSVDAGRVDVGGAPKQLNVARLGQAQKLVFAGKTGQKLGFGITDVAQGAAIPSLSVVAPNGKSWQLTPGADAEMPEALPVDGDYTLWFNPVPNTGTYTLWGSEDVNGGLLPLDGEPAEISVDRPGQNVRFTINATAGQKAGLGMLHPWGTGLIAVLRDPTGKKLVDIGARNNVDFTFPTTGTYEFLADLGAVSGVGTFVLSSDLNKGEFSDTVVLPVQRAGQNARATFQGTAGQRISLGFSDTTLNGQYRVKLFQPNGTEIGGGFGSVYAGRDDKDIVLPVAGTYEIQLDPTDENTGTGEIKVTLSTAVNGGTLTVGGAAVPLVLPRVGQDGTLTFAGTAGQKLALTFAGNNFQPSKNFRVSVLGPDGKPLTGLDGKLKTDTANLAVPALPSAGNYTVVIDGDRAATGGITVGLIAG
ncbi:IPT/TIG domain-containing protein [Crossiella cryophila]|uniref:Plastocyanin n=1 Tax=Crossiella cryophila TaxID=43355 RepID=A0A7W7FTT1_9PSEU|nr:IPT/TIG domain-containing protein [Crossiella cryophila]MBB4678516.1 plastocyanin [Crossiella cryophila]